MANGKIIFTPIATKALLFDEAHYLSLDEADFNVGTGNFGVDALLTIDPTITESLKSWIAAKGASNMNDAAGWHFYYIQTTRRLGLRINDGGVTSLVVETADNQIPAHGTEFWARLQTDRAGQARFYVNGVDVGGGSIAAKAGSLDNSELLKVGGYTTSANRHKGSLDFLRFDLGRILPAAWHVKEWDNIRYGMPRKVSDSLAMWNFQESLVDDSENLFTLAWQGGGSPTYVTGYPSVAAPLTYSFRRNFSRMDSGPQPSWLDTDDNQRAINGAAFGYAGALKERWALNFPLMQDGQLAAFKAAEASRGQFAFYADADERRTFWAKFGERLAPQVLMDGWYSLEMILEEV